MNSNAASTFAAHSHPEAEERQKPAPVPAPAMMARRNEGAALTSRARRAAITSKSTEALALAVYGRGLETAEGTGAGTEPGTAPAMPAESRTPGPPLVSRVRALLWKEKGPAPLGKYSQAQIERETGWNAGYLSQWLNWKDGDPPLRWDVRKYESMMFEFLVNLEAPAQEAEMKELVPTAATEDLAEFCASMERSGDCGVYFSDAGTGKDCGVRLLKYRKPRTIVVFVDAALKSVESLVNELFKKLALRDTRQVSKVERVMKRLTETPRQIVVNNAQELPRGAFNLFFGIYNRGDGKAKRTTIVFVGNPEIEKKIVKCDQHASRIQRLRDGNKVWRERPGSLEAACREMIRLHCPGEGHEKALLKLCVKLAGVEEGNRLRGVVKRLKDVREALANGFKGTLEEAFRGAYALSYSKTEVEL